MNKIHSLEAEWKDGKNVLSLIKKERNPETGWAQIDNLTGFDGEMEKKLKYMVSQNLVIMMKRSIRFKNGLVADLVK